MLWPAGVAGELVRLVAVLDPNGCPDKVLLAQAGVRYCGERLGRDVTTDDVRSGLRNLHRLSVVDHDVESGSGSVRMHALAQRGVREGLDEPELAYRPATRPRPRPPGHPDHSRGRGVLEAACGRA